MSILRDNEKHVEGQKETVEGAHTDVEVNVDAGLDMER